MACQNSLQHRFVETRRLTKLSLLGPLGWALLLGCDQLNLPKRAATDKGEASQSSLAADAGEEQTIEAGPLVPSKPASPGGLQDAPKERGFPRQREAEPAETRPNQRRAKEDAPTRDGPSQRASAPPQSSRDRSTSIELSAGTALAQTLPTGTAMGFSVDYKTISRGSSRGSRYVWVIRASGAQPAWDRVIRLQSSGTLRTFVTQWKPRHGPFETFIAEVRPDGSRRQVSRIESLRSN